MSMSELKDFFAWCDRKGLTFGEFVEASGQVWFQEKAGPKLDAVIAEYLMHRQGATIAPRYTSR